jgi:hypothetical protein
VYLYNSFQVQSIAWTVLAAIGISLYTCGITVNFDESNPMYFLYFVYFFSKYATDSFNIRAHPALGIRVFQTGATKRFLVSFWSEEFSRRRLDSETLVQCQWHRDGRRNSIKTSPLPLHTHGRPVCQLKHIIRRPKTNVSTWQVVRNRFRLNRVGNFCDLIWHHIVLLHV